MSLDSLCRWQVQVSVYCAWRIPAHLRCTQCSILLHRMDICFLTCICLWQISQIQTCLFNVVGPGLVSTSPAFVSNNASHPAGPACPKIVNRGGSTQFAQQFGFAVTAPLLVGCISPLPSTLNTPSPRKQLIPKAVTCQMRVNA